MNEERLRNALKDIREDMVAAAFAAGAEAMREVAAQVVMDARMGERDSDLRSIIHGVRALPIPPMELNT